MGIVIEERPSSFSGRSLQILGQVGSSALDTVMNGISNYKKLEAKHLNLFNRFERNSFESLKTPEKNFLNAAEYGSPAQVLRNFEGRTHSKEVLKKIEDPQFKISDALAKFAGKQIAKKLSMAPNSPISGVYAHVENRRGVFSASTEDKWAKLQKLEQVVQKQLDLSHFIKIRASK